MKFHSMLKTITTITKKKENKKAKDSILLKVLNTCVTKLIETLVGNIMLMIYPLD